jgi:hypothetical protein
VIALYPGICVHCKKPTRAGLDHYDRDTKMNYHEACAARDELFAQAEAESLAERLGYRRYRWDELISPAKEES